MLERMIRFALGLSLFASLVAFPLGTSGTEASQAPKRPDAPQLAPYVPTPQDVVDRLADTFGRTGGDIRAVMQTLVDSPAFWRADNTLFKTPLDFACSALTASGGARDRRDIALTLGFLAQAGQPLHGWQTPDGYNTDAATWLAPEALTRRADYAMALGSRMPEPAYLQPFFSAATRERIAQEAPAARAGLMLASPDFMNK